MKPVNWTSQAVLDALKEIEGDVVVLAELVTATGLTARQTADACTTLVAHEILKRVCYANGNVKPGQFEISEAGRLAIANGVTLTSGPREAHGKPRVTSGTTRERIWRLLRIRKRLSVPETVALLSDAGDDTTRLTATVQKYLRVLRRAGYLADMRREPGTALTSNGFKRYILVRDSGPAAPTLRRGRNSMYDPNDGVEHELA